MAKQRHDCEHCRHFDLEPGDTVTTRVNGRLVRPGERVTIRPNDHIEYVVKGPIRDLEEQP